MTTTEAITAETNTPPTGSTPPTGNTIDISPAEKLRDECGGCRLSFSWFRTSIKVDHAAKLSMAGAVESTEQGFSASKRLMDSKHPAIKKANELRNRIHSYWTAMSLPLAAAHVQGEAKLEGGTRLIRKDQVAEFHQRMTAFKSEAETISKEVNDNLSDIKDMDKERLGKLFREEDYPTEIDLTFSWGFPNIDVPSYLAELAPEVYEAERQAVASRFEQTYEVATMAMLQEFKAVVESWVDRLGPVIRIYPPVGHEHREYNGAEVISLMQHRHDPANIPEGHVKIELRHKPDGKKTSEAFWMGPMSMKAYNELRPSEIGQERKTFKDTTIQNLMDLLAKFRLLGSTISASQDFSRIVSDMETHLANCVSSEDAAHELRNSKTFRTQTHLLMQKLDANISAEISTFQVQRRSVTRG